jgi:hypothetical protein
MLNNLWGKFGQNDDMTFVDYFVDAEKWFVLLDRVYKKEVEMGHVAVDGEYLYCKHREINKKKLHLRNTNMAIAAFTTSYARLRLYEAFRIIGFDRVIYCDTDSVFYTVSDTEPNLPYGDKLGEFKRENKYPIREFVALGPKTYSYLYGDSSALKCKGFGVERFKLAEGQEYDGPRRITFATYHDLLHSAMGKGLAYDYMMFDRKHRTIHTVIARKILKFEYDKRVIVDLENTLPFGYRG